MMTMRKFKGASTMKSAILLWCLCIVFAQGTCGHETKGRRLYQIPHGRVQSIRKNLQTTKLSFSGDVGKILAMAEELARKKALVGDEGSITMEEVAGGAYPNAGVMGASTKPPADTVEGDNVGEFMLSPNKATSHNFLGPSTTIQQQAGGNMHAGATGSGTYITGSETGGATGANGDGATSSSAGTSAANPREKNVDSSVLVGESAAGDNPPLTSVEVDREDSFNPGTSSEPITTEQEQTNQEDPSEETNIGAIGSSELGYPGGETDTSSGTDSVGTAAGSGVLGESSTTGTDGAAESSGTSTAVNTGSDGEGMGSSTASLSENEVGGQDTTPQAPVSSAATSVGSSSGAEDSPTSTTGAATTEIANGESSSEVQDSSVTHATGSVGAENEDLADEEVIDPSSTVNGGGVSDMSDKPTSDQTSDSEHSLFTVNEGVSETPYGDSTNNATETTVGSSTTQGSKSDGQGTSTNATGSLSPGGAISGAPTLVGDGDSPEGEEKEGGSSATIGGGSQVDGEASTQHDVDTEEDSGVEPEMEMADPVTLLSCNGSSLFHPEVIEFSYSLETNSSDFAWVDNIRALVEEKVNEFVADQLLSCFSGAGSRQLVTDLGFEAVDSNPKDDYSKITGCEATEGVSNDCTIFDGFVTLYTSEVVESEYVKYHGLTAIRDAMELLAQEIEGLVKATYLGPAIINPSAIGKAAVGPTDPQLSRPVNSTSIVLFAVGGCAFAASVGLIYYLRRHGPYAVSGAATQAAGSDSNQSGQDDERPLSPFSEMLPTAYRFDDGGNMSAILELDDESATQRSGIVVSDSGFTTEEESSISMSMDGHSITPSHVGALGKCSPVLGARKRQDESMDSLLELL